MTVVCSEAIALERESLEKHLRVFGARNIGTINAMLNLGEFQRDAGREDEALRTFQDLLAKEALFYSPEQGETAGTRVRSCFCSPPQGTEG